MTEYRIHFSNPRAVNVEAESEAEARELVNDRSWEYGMDWDDGDIEILEVEEI